MSFTENTGTITNITNLKPKNDKRTRLIDAANQLFHEQGVSNTTLANIAQLADVPLGNVYYYFKSKDSIVEAVIEAHNKGIKRILEELSMINDTKSRLLGFIDKLMEKKEHTANYGDALGSLCQELGKQGGKIAESASTLMQQVINWSTEQFKQLGKDTIEAEHLSFTFVSSLQGLCLLTLTFRDPEYMSSKSSYIINWVKSI